MTSIEEAIALVDQHTALMDSENIKLSEALGRVLAADVASLIDMPPFDQSSMDGYAVNYDPSISSYELIGEIPAGSGERIDLKLGQACRIFTGAAVPETANTVIKQEIVAVEGNKISFTEAVRVGMNIRPQGEQIVSGDVALKNGTALTAGGIGFLAALGITEVEVYKKPKICILTTGSELVKPGRELTYGKVYESNSLMLVNAFKSVGFEVVCYDTILDNYEETVDAITASLKETDVVILSGGISVGEYDFVGKALTDIGVDQIFYKVNQKPGKPLFYGKYQQKSIFALPGNPAAALTSFYTYIYPALNKMVGIGFHGCRTTKLALTHDYTKKGDRANILKALACNGTVEIMGAQSSAMLSSFAHANALVLIPADQSELKNGEQVTTMLLP